LLDPVLKAISFAARRHHGQMRKDGETPYVAHPFRVMTTVLREFGVADPDTLAAAVLHDTLEDTRTDHDDISAEFGPTVADHVALLTKDKRFPEEERERRYFEGLAAAPLAVRLVKIADTVDNLRDAREGAGNLAKTLKKAERLLSLYAGDERLARALAVLRDAMET